MNYQFKIKMTSVGLGYVEADSLEEARKLINSGDYDDIYDEVDCEHGEIIEIWEDNI